MNFEKCNIDIYIFLTVPCVTRFLAGLHITHSFYFLMWSHILFFLFLFNKFIFVHLINRKQKKVEKSNPISKSISETLCHSWTTLSCEQLRFNMFGSKVTALSFLFLLLLSFSNCESQTETTMHTNNWAVLVCTSRFW